MMMFINHYIEEMKMNLPAITMLRNVNGERIVYIFERNSLEILLLKYLSRIANCNGPDTKDYDEK